MLAIIVSNMDYLVVIPRFINFSYIQTNRISVISWNDITTIIYSTMTHHTLSSNNASPGQLVVYLMVLGCLQLKWKVKTNICKMLQFCMNVLVSLFILAMHKIKIQHRYRWVRKLSKVFYHVGIKLFLKMYLLKLNKNVI